MNSDSLKSVIDTDFQSIIAVSKNWKRFLEKKEKESRIWKATLPAVFIWTGYLAMLLRALVGLSFH